MKISARPDFSHGLIHFTRRRSGKRRHFDPASKEDFFTRDDTKIEPFDVLSEILADGALHGSNNSGFIKGNQTAVCFSEVPLGSVRYFVTGEGARYSPYGVAISKSAAFKMGARPVIYLPDGEGDWIPAEQKWRQVRFEHGNVDFTHEREWRLPGDLDLHKLPGFYLLIWNPRDAVRLEELLSKYPNLRGVLPMEHLLDLF